MGTSASAPRMPPLATLNRKLNLEPVQSLATSQTVPAATRPAVLSVLFCPPKPGNATATDDSSLYRVLVVTQTSIEEFCLVTGNRGMRVYREDEGRVIAAARWVDAGGSVGKGVMVCNDAGRVRLVDVDTMRSKATLDMSVKLRPENDEITAISPLENGSVALGHKNGLLEVLSVGSWCAKSIFNDAKKGEIPGILKLAYWKKGKTLLSGHNDTFVSAEGTNVTLESFEIRLYSVDFAEENELIRGKSGELPGFVGKCLDLSVIDPQNLAVALSSVNNRVFIWSLQSKKLIFLFTLPQMTPKLSVSSCFSVISQPDNSTIITFGMSDGTAIVSQLSLNADLRLNWTPLKLIKEKEIQSGENRGVTAFEYDEVIDVMAIGDRQGKVRLINNFEWEIGRKVEEGKHPLAVEQSNPPLPVAPTRPDHTNASGFTRYLHERKEVLQTSRPDLPYKDLLISITEEWQHMSADARLAYNRPVSEINTPV